MPTHELVALLTAERDKLNRAIEALNESGPRRGRPATKKAAASPVAAAAAAEPAARHLSAASRRKMAQAQKRRWAAWRAAQKAAKS
jgi:hypothetical protein